MSIKMIVTDLDRTLLRTDKTISDYTADVLKRCQERGIKVVFATARSTQAASRFTNKCTPDALIVYGGALVKHGGNTIHCFDMSAEMSDDLIKSCMKAPDTKAVYAINEEFAFTNDISYTLMPDSSHYMYNDFSEPINMPCLKISLINGNPDSVDAISGRFPQYDMLRYSGEDLYRFAHAKALKWDALVILAKYLGIKTQEIVAFGDDFNDLEMICECGIGVAVANAIDEVKAVADQICETNDDDGVAKWIVENLRVKTVGGKIMSRRLDCVKEYVNNIFDHIDDSSEKCAAYIHSFGVAHCCALLAAKRSLDMELATIIGLMHDVYSYKTGVTALHAQNGAEMVRVAFKYRLNDLFSEDEQTTIKSAIYHHTNKNLVHDAYDELLKDGDILQHLSLDTTYGWVYGQRLLQIMRELSLPAPKITLLPKEKAVMKPFNQSSVGDMAEALAEKKITGEKSDAEYMKIIRYFPEETAFDELRNAWCAAFVYHCCLEAGLLLPIRAPHTADKIANCRFACVVAWFEWGMENGFCHYEKDGFTPERGDIVIYNNIIPKENKPENSTWCDHIGIVLSCDDTALIVAEGNAGNMNVSEIINRKRNDSIGCYIRIPKDYAYNGWKIDFKTGETKIVNFE